MEMNRPAPAPSRSKEKYDFWVRRFRHDAVIEVFKGKVFDLFDNCCFRCGADGPLVIDHHMPRSRGGRLEAGNLVVLCRRCNNVKGEADPNVFYGGRHLERLSPLLDQQHALFDFQWDWKAFNADRADYFRSLGVPEAKVLKVFGDPDHPGYWGQSQDEPGMTITVNIDADFLGKVVTNRRPGPWRSWTDRLVRRFRSWLAP